jgi:PiT family inorganic phosphate transporter
MPDSHLILITVIIAALLFDFSNGWNDSANAIATVVSTKVLPPLIAVIMAAVLNFLGAYLSTKVAKTIGGDIVDPAHLDQIAILSAMLAAFIWASIMTLMGLPISGSHSLIAGILGAVIFTKGSEFLKTKGIMKILISLGVSPVFGLLGGFFAMWLLMWILKSFSPSRINKFFGKLQILSSAYMALMHGTNDAQKVMGVITMALVSAGKQNTLDVPLWVVTLCALAMGLGTGLGGWRVIRTLGVNLLKLQPVHGFAAETACATVLMSAASMGLPVSTTHAITGSIIGVGSAWRFSAVRWGIGRKIIFAWVFTFPFCILLAGFINYIIRVIF